MNTKIDKQIDTQIDSEIAIQIETELSRTPEAANFGKKLKFSQNPEASSFWTSRHFR